MRWILLYKDPRTGANHVYEKSFATEYEGVTFARSNQIKNYEVVPEDEFTSFLQEQQEQREQERRVQYYQSRQQQPVFEEEESIPRAKPIGYVQHVRPAGKTYHPDTFSPPFTGKRRR